MPIMRPCCFDKGGNEEGSFCQTRKNLTLKIVIVGFKAIEECCEIIVRIAEIVEFEHGLSRRRHIKPRFPTLYRKTFLKHLCLQTMHHCFLPILPRLQFRLPCNTLFPQSSDLTQALLLRQGMLPHKSLEDFLLRQLLLVIFV